MEHVRDAVLAGRGSRNGVPAAALVAILRLVVPRLSLRLHFRL